tara:strand:- start:356 stop:1171 length:816 start_codon:yes stop_codon:yes gene_type:complete
MIPFLKNNNWFVIKFIIAISILIPLGILTYEFIVLGNESVVFLANYPLAISIIIIVYYSIIIVSIIVWLISKLLALLTLKNEMRKISILHLQSQVNPHFFFNMLNTVYGLVDQDTDKTKKLILKLSEVMRYSIYEGDKMTVTIEEEVNYIHNFIELQKIRYHKTIEVKFTTHIEKNISITPLMLIMLVENAFKHGVENLRENAYVHITLKVDDHKMIFEIENNFDESEPPQKEGIGLSNLKRRLELVYPKMHELTIASHSRKYKAQLLIQL